MKILFIGDIMGSPGRKTAAALLPVLQSRMGPFDFLLANCENAAAGRGITGKTAEELFSLGIDAMTSGNHIWDKNEGIAVLVEDFVVDGCFRCIGNNVAREGNQNRYGARTGHAGGQAEDG